MTTRKALAAVADQEQETEYPASMTLAEVMDSMTGYDEIGIEQNLSRSLQDLADDDSGKSNDVLLARACIAVYRQHECGDTPAAGWKFAMTLPLKQVMGYFPPKSLDEQMGLGDTSDAGKDMPRPASAQQTKPGSAS